MSRVAKKPIELPNGVEANLQGRVLTIKGTKGSLQKELHAAVQYEKDGNVIKLAPQTIEADAVTGTTRAILYNMVVGVSQGFERKLILIGVGYRAQAQGSVLSLTLGFSHPVKYDVPQGITIETPSQTEIVVKGIDKEKVGQVAADIRAYRPPEPYKGKGVRYANEVVIKKEGKKK
ncbi:MAG: 50S ribosomal protein L6 [Gammaproteobacteria bacterium]